MLKEVAIIVMCLGIVVRSSPVIMFYPQQPQQPASADDNTQQFPSKPQKTLQDDKDENFQKQLEAILRDIINMPNAAVENKMSDSEVNNNDVVLGSEFQRRQHWSQGFLPGGK